MDGDAARVGAEHRMQALLHFRCGPAREGDGQALRTGDAASATRWAMRWVSVRVLPEPGPATISSGP